MQSFSEIRDRLIAVDTEYQTLEKPSEGATSLERETTIHRVWCAAFYHDGDAPLTIWTGDRDEYPNILADAAHHFHVDSPVFVNYAYFAEWEAFKRLGADVGAFPWIDVALLYKLATNAFGEKPEQSLVAMCSDVLGVCIDSAHKEEMRNLCINGNVEGYEREIMDYCAEDTAHLLPALFALDEKLSRRYHNPVTLVVNAADRGARAVPFAELFMGMMESLRCFTAISHRGLPVDGERLQAVRRGARVVRDRQIRAFVEKYPGTWELLKPSTKTLDKFMSEDDRLRAVWDAASVEEVFADFQERIADKSEKTQAILSGQFESWYDSHVKGCEGIWKRNERECRRYLLDDLRNRGLLAEYPRTDSGKLSLSKDALYDTFGKATGTFGGDFRELSARLTSYNGLLADGKKDWLAAYDAADGIMRYRTLNPFNTVTGRCAPQPARGWVFGWDKSLYCVLNPREGKWLVELDFSSEETFIQARVFNDDAYKELYYSKDIYLYTGVLTGIIPRDDYDALTKSELKAKYKKQRDILKTFTLAIGYGAGDVTLAGKTGLSLEKVERFRERYDAAFGRSAHVRDVLGDRIDNGKTRCIWLANGWNAVIKPKLLTTLNSPLNFPIQGTGSVILHKVVRELEAAGIRTLATIHDAVFFEVDADDWLSIASARGIMKRVADDVLGVQADEPGMKVGEPEIIRHGEIWTPEHEFDALAREILEAGGYGL